MGKLSIRLFGRLKVSDGAGGEVSLSGRKPRALLAYLALNAGEAQPRDRLAALLWGDRFEEQARQSLRQCISQLRKTLDDAEPGVLLTNGDDVGLNADATDIDAGNFVRLAAEGTADTLAKAAGLYGGVLIDGLDVKEKGFEDWIGAERARFNDLACEVLAKLGQYQAAAGDTGAAIDTARRLVALDPLREEAHRALMQLYAQTGRRAQALKQFQVCAEGLRRDLGVEPETETARLYAGIQGQEAPSSAAGANADVSAVEPEGGPPLPDKPSIAVLPFSNLSNEPGQEYFADGITEDIITGLSRFRSLFVIARNSTFAYKGKSPDVREVARDLGVRYVLEGSVRRAGERIRITGQLIDAGTGNHLWVERYDRKLEDIFAVQDEVTEAIVAAIAPEISDVERKRAQRKPPGNLDAWDLYQRGLTAYHSSTDEAFRSAIEHFDRVNEIDPTFAPAFAMAAGARVRYVLHFEPDDRDEHLNQAREKAHKATSLDPRDPLCLLHEGRVHSMLGHHDAAISKVEEAIALNPNDALSRFNLGVVLCTAGRTEEAIPHIDHAMRLSPRDVFLTGMLTHRAFCLFDLNRYEEAFELVHRASLRTNPRSMTFALLTAVLTRLGREEEARVALKDLLAHAPGMSCAKYRDNRFGAPEVMERFVDALRETGLPE